jgi:DNA-binding GntR family transcriptional regulator
MKMPLYTQIQNYIVEQIETGRWPSQYQLPPERTLAEQFDVSRITAKNAIKGLVEDGYVYRHQGKGTFVSDMKQVVKSAPLARSKKIIGFIVPWIEYRYQCLLFSGVESELKRLGYHVIFNRIDQSSESESKAIQEMLSIPVDGLIVSASQGKHFHDDLIRLVLGHFPVVMVEKYMRDINAHGVYCDTERAGYLMGQYIANRKINDICLFTYPAMFSLGVKERIFGLQSAIVEHGIVPLTPDKILTVSAEVLDLNQQLDPVIPSEMLDFLNANRHIKAIAAVDAMLAKLAGLACAQLQLNDMLIVCCDEPSYGSGCLMPAAYVDQSPFELGTRAARLLVEAIMEKIEMQHILVEPKLVEPKLFGQDVPLVVP